jgi:hypothetical protein
MRTLLIAVIFAVTTTAIAAIIVAATARKQIVKEEVNVQYILAKGFDSVQLGILGFPAYDVDRILIGFYREHGVPGEQTKLVLRPVDQVTGLQEEEMEVISRVIQHLKCSTTYTFITEFISFEV